MSTNTRCPWVGKLPIYIDYHDKEWGKPQFDSQKLFEKICLEGQQAGLSWITVLKNAKPIGLHSINLILLKLRK